MFPWVLALRVLLMTTAFTASAQLSPLTSATASIRITTGEKPQPTLKQVPGRMFPKRQSEACPRIISTTIPVLTTIILAEPATIHLTITMGTAEPTLSGQVAAASVSARDAIPCFDCIQNRAAVTRQEARSPGHHVLEAREPFPLTGNSTACNVTISTTLLVPSTITVRPTITKIVAVPPKLLTPADSLEGTSKNVVQTSSLEILQTSIGRSESSTSTAWLKERPPLETTVSAPDGVPPVVTTGQATKLGGSLNSQPASPVPSISTVLSPRPASGQAESDNQVRTTQLPAVVPGQQPRSSVLSILTTYIPVASPTRAVIPAPPPVITLGTNIYSPILSSSVYVVDGQTLSPGGPAITVSNSILSLATIGTQLVVAPTGTVNDGQPANPATTIQLFPDQGSTPSSIPNILLAPAPAPIVATIGNSPITLDPKASSIVFTSSIGGIPVTILPGSAALTLPGGTVISLTPSTPTSNSQSALLAPPVLIISTIGAPNAQRITFPNPPPPGPPTPAPAPSQDYIPIRISGDPPSIIVGDSNGISASITLAPGAPAITLDSGIPISLGTETSILVLGSSTITIAATATGIGGYLYSGLGIGSAGASLLGSGSRMRMSTILTSSMVVGGTSDLGLNTEGVVASSLPASRNGSGVSGAAVSSSIDKTLRTVSTSSAPAASSINPRSTLVVQNKAACDRLVSWVGALSWLSSLLTVIFLLR